MLHPGRILLEDYLAPKGISVLHLAKEIHVSPRRIYEIIQGQRPITNELALRLAHYLGLSKRFWLDLQARYDVQLEVDAKSAKVVDIARSRKVKLLPPSV